ncbi:hypothetical protein DL766_009364 [Monosporascus sp. MC13-8B]|uniref:Beta-lactamase-related domain-containing protein n=1 Tax=Monosporascus cannonballus TaxID=155416 RepID=A0ABY0H0V0_9PEZI|nr:hypothetical protein DL762_006844 [Monosporascus cannonballus]RYP15605.1 hypothetical protein DL766_009364 [Monosporascus sp. MC13-8B]
MKLLTFLPILPATVLALECRPEGPIYPRPRNLSESKTFQEALANFTAILNGAFNGDIRTGWDIHNVSLSTGIVGLDQTDASTPLWEYHHLASGNINGTQSIDRHSQYLIGSVSKAISDAILIKSGVSMDDPVTKHLPALKGHDSLIDWESISLRALGGQLAGIPPNYGFSEYHYLKFYFEALGFPHINDSAYPPCGVIGLSAGPCTKQQLLLGMKTSHPLAPPHSRPIYSNIAYTILAYALESSTGRNYTQLLHSLITRPLHMPSTFPSGLGNDSLAVIPPVPNSWGSDYGDNVPGGGLISTLSDLSSFVHAILSRNPHLATPTQIHEWLQPRSFAGSRNSFLGFPWEIFRPNPSVLFPGYNETSGEGGHSVTIHAKDGAAYGYRARIALLDEYGVGLAFLTAGNQDALTTIYDAALSVLVPALDAVAREQAEERYVGKFVGRSTPETGGVDVDVSTEVDGVSLVLTGMARNGSDILDALVEFWKVSLGVVLPTLKPTGTFRLYPAGIKRPRRMEDGRETVTEDWRMMWEFEQNADTDLPGKGISEKDCLTWAVGDWMHYGSEPIDRVVYVKDRESGEVFGVDLPFLRSGVLNKDGEEK